MVGSVAKVTKKLSSGSMLLSSTIGTDTHVLLVSGSMVRLRTVLKKSSSTSAEGEGWKEEEEG